MAKYTGTAGCGHHYEIDLYGPTKERTRRLEWMDSASGMCNPCYAASKRTQEATQADAAVKALADKILIQYNGLPSPEIAAKARALAAANATTQPARAAQMLAALDLLGV